MRTITVEAAARDPSFKIRIVTSVVFFLVLVASLWQRVQLGTSSAQMDEHDYLFVAKMLLAGKEWPTHTYIFGSDLSWYLLGWGEQFLGGITGARLIAMVAGLLSCTGLYLFAREFWQSSRVAWVATLLLASSANHIFISRLATYDSISFALFSLSLMPLMRGCVESNASVISRYKYTLVGSTLLVLAVLAKYPAILYLPFIGFFILITARRQFWVWATVVGAGIGSYTLFHWSDLKVLFDVQIMGTHGANTTYGGIAKGVAIQAGLPLAMSLLAVLCARVKYSRERDVHRKLFLLLLMSTPLVMYHFQGKNLISLYKHINFSLYFLLIASAWLVVEIYNRCQGLYYRSRKRMVLAGLSISLCFYWSLNYVLLKEMEKGYPDTAGLTEHIADINQIPDVSVLSEDPYLIRYHHFDNIPQQKIKETSWLDNDNDNTRSYQDVVDALWDRKFEVVLLTDAVHPKRNDLYRSILDKRGYRKTYSEFYELSSIATTNRSGQLSVYRKGELSAEFTGN